MTLTALVAVIRRWLYLSDLGPLYATLGTVAANVMAGEPVWLILVGPPSSGKSEILQALTGLECVFSAATLNEAALLSGTAKKERDDDATGGLLRQIGDFGIIVCKDFTSILSMHREAQRALLAALREIYDGSWTRRLGSGGGMTLDWKGKVGLLAGCTHAIESAHTVTSAMGERFIQYRMPLLSDAAERAQARAALTRRQREEQMRAELAGAVSEFFAALSLPLVPPALSNSEIECLEALAMFVARARSAVERDSYRRDIDFVPPPEVSTRLFLNLKGLFSGLLAIGVPRGPAWHIVLRVGFDSIPGLRRSILELLIDPRKFMYPHAIADRTGCSKTAVERALEDLQAHGLVGGERGGGRVASRWGLTDWAWTQYQLAAGSLPEMSVDAG